MERVNKFLTRLTERYLPDAFVIAIGLTVITMLLAIIVKGTGIITAVTYWGDGFWDLLAFTTQMVVILAAGYVLAKAPVVDKTMDFIAAKIDKPKTAIVMVTFISSIGFLVNWGFGLIIGGIFGQKLSLKVKGVHYPLMIAAAFSGFTFYGLGLSGSVPILISTSGHFLEDEMGIIPLSDTIFSFPMLMTTLVLLFTLPFVNAWLHPKNKDDIIEINPTLFQEDKAKAEIAITNKITLADRFNNSNSIGIGIGIIGLIYIVSHFTSGGFIDLNIVNFLLIFLGILLMGNPNRYLASLQEGIKLVPGIVLQYPFYAGIMGILVGSGLVLTFSEFFVNISSVETLPLWSLMSGFFVNILAPSGGGQWVVQGPIMIEAAENLGASYFKVAMGVQLGDAWNTVIQPFWLIPILAISKLKLNDVMGYLIIISIWIGIIFISSFLIWGYMG